MEEKSMRSLWKENCTKERVEFLSTYQTFVQCTNCTFVKIVDAGLYLTDTLQSLVM